MHNRLSRIASRLSPRLSPHSGPLGPFRLLAAFVAVAVPLHGQQPSWNGDAGTTRAEYQFTTDSLNPAPEVLENPYGNPTATVTVTAPFGTGWQDPAAQFSTPGVNADGAWDLGPDGSIALTIPFTSSPTDPGLDYRVEFYLYMVAYEVPVALPVISAPGLVLENVSSSSQTVKQDTLGRYTGVTWTAEAPVGSGNTVNLLFTATSAGAVIDSIDIYTRVITTGTPQNVYSAWTTENYPGQTNPTIIGFEAAPEGDGVANGLKYFLGVGKDVAASALKMLDGSSGSATFTHTRDKTGAPDVNASYEWSRNLSTWYGDGESDGAVSVEFDALVTDLSHPDFDQLSVTATVTSGSTDRIFCRLKVSQIVE